MGAIIDQPQILQYQDVPSLWGRGGGGGGGGGDVGLKKAPPNKHLKKWPDF